MTVYVDKNQLLAHPKAKEFIQYAYKNHRATYDNSIFDLEDPYPFISYDKAGDSYSCLDAVVAPHGAPVLSAEGFISLFPMKERGRVRKKVRKSPLATTSRVLIKYTDGTSYTVKKPLRLVVEERETCITISESQSTDYAVSRQDIVRLDNNFIDTIDIVSPRFTSWIGYSHGSSRKIIIVENGNTKTITRAEFNISGNK